MRHHDYCPFGSGEVERPPCYGCECIAKAVTEKLQDLAAADCTHLGQWYTCEACGHVFNWSTADGRKRGTSADGLRVCTSCQSDFVRKLRDADLVDMLRELRALRELSS